MSESCVASEDQTYHVDSGYAARRIVTSVNKERRVQIVVFTDWDHWVPRVLMNALLVTLADYPALQVIAVCVPRSSAHSKRVLTYASRRVIGWVKALCLGDRRHLHREPGPVSLRRLAREHGFAVHTISDPNSPEAAAPFAERQTGEILISLFWKRRFSASFLARFEQAVNYHNGSVPNYRGLRATPWSIYRCESHSGFTFHRISERIDLGNVLVEGSVPIAIEAGPLEVEKAKTLLAASRWPEVLDAIVANKPGIPQQETTKYNRVSEIARLTRIVEPNSVTAAELLRRIRAFGPVQVTVGAALVWVSGLGRLVGANASRRLPCLRLADGVWCVKTSDWRSHRLKLLTQLIVRARTTVERS